MIDLIEQCGMCTNPSFIYEYLFKVDLNVEEWIKNISAPIRIIPHKARYDLKQ